MLSAELTTKFDKMNRTELEKIHKKHIQGYLAKDRMARFEDIPTRIFIDAMEEALSIANVVGTLPCDECVDGEKWSPYYAKYVKCDCRK